MTWIDNQISSGATTTEKVAEAAAKLTAESPDYLASSGGDVHFALYVRLVDALMRKHFGITHNDIADFLWRDAFDAGTKPDEAIKDALANDEIFGWAG